MIIRKDSESFDEIFPQWEVLRTDFYDSTIFQDRNWLRNWWHYKSNQGKKITPYILEIVEEGQTIGILPLYQSSKRIKGIEIRMLEPIGTGNSDYLLPILSKKYSPDRLLKLAFEKIYQDKEWDILEWGSVPEDTNFASFIDNHFYNYSGLVKIFRSETCPFIRIRGDINDLQQTFDPNFLKGVRYKERKISKLGELRFVKVSSEREIEPVMNKFFELHCERWEHTNTPSGYRYKEERDYALEAAKGLFKNNLLYLAYLSVNDEIVVVHFGMGDGKRKYFYLHSINMKFQKYSPGKLLVHRLAIEACKEGYEVLDFLRGDEEYKHKWGTTENFNHKYQFFNNSPKSMLLKSGYKMLRSNASLKNLAKKMLIKT
ncbi:GNAT family N-acetyltransferase [Robertmurraya kyonggiensis]|uniref:GNAT family N-acetyltransferase n=1 Tax=Robertmurraya kyonggiensis TaxID=1037680 RepID=UPI001FEA09AD|nr:GNAT family N-acetyltransferase [Robertmurraya kyonggiensis]